jgi:hypothetical protein
MHRARSWERIALVTLIGCLADFLMPRLSTAVGGAPSAASAEADRKAAAVEAEKLTDGNKKADAEKKSGTDAKPECQCAVTSCPASDGMQHMSAPCSVKCREGMSAECKCGACKEGGGLDRPSVCQCKRVD